MIFENRLKKGKHWNRLNAVVYENNEQVQQFKWK